MTVEQIANQINWFDSFYEMSDDANKIIVGTDNENRIKFMLQNLSKEHIWLIESRLSVSGKLNYERYFKK